MARARPILARLVLVGGLSLVCVAPAGAGPAEAKACEDLSRDAVRLLTEADKTGDVATARRGAALLERAIVLCPDDPDIVFKLTLAYVLAHEEDNARASLRRLETVLRAQARGLGRPETEVTGDPRYLYAHARIRYTFGNDPRGALDDVTRLRARDPQFLPGPVSSLEFRCLLAYANLLVKSGDLKEAIRQTRQALVVARGDQQRQDIARRNLAQLLRGQDQWIEAQQIFEELATRYPRDAVLHYALASVLADQMKWEEALAAWRKVLALAAEPDTVDPREKDQLADARMRYGMTLLHGGHLDEGKAELLAYAKANDKDARVWFHLGEAAIDYFDDPDSALAWLEKARSLDPWCERTLRLLLDLYSNARKDDGRARAIQATLDSPQETAARKKEMERRARTRPDGMTGCD